MDTQSFFPQRPDAVPTIYAYRLVGVESHKGYLKVGYTDRDVETRVKEQSSQMRVPYEIVLRESAMSNDGSCFTDHDVHALLKKQGCLQLNAGEDKNEWFKCTNADRFDASADIRTIFKHIYENRVAVPTSVQWGGLLGHVVTIVGFEATSEEDLIAWIDGKDIPNPINRIVVDDPWGKLIEATNKYDGTQSGNDNEFSYDFFDKHWKSVDSRTKKYAHIISRPAVLV